MIIKTQKTFSPITLIVETEEELLYLERIAGYYAGHKILPSPDEYNFAIKLFEELGKIK